MTSDNDMQCNTEGWGWYGIRRFNVEDDNGLSSL